MFFHMKRVQMTRILLLIFNSTFGSKVYSTSGRIQIIIGDGASVREEGSGTRLEDRLKMKDLETLKHAFDVIIIHQAALSFNAKPRLISLEILQSILTDQQIAGQSAFTTSQRRIHKLSINTFKQRNRT